jgi:hypothetical protein
VRVSLQPLIEPVLWIGASIDERQKVKLQVASQPCMRAGQPGRGLRATETFRCGRMSQKCLERTAGAIIDNGLRFRSSPVA